MSGTIRIGNKRAGAAAKPVNGETVIHGDRMNPVLGNPFVLSNHRDPQERAKVIESYRHKFNKDWELNGPMRKETEAIADRVAAGENVILMCWCAGAPHHNPCHLDLIKARMLDRIKGTPGAHYAEAEAAHAKFLERTQW